MALHSDHVNYLIFRYLQESGLEQTARSLAGEWQRPYDMHDPERFHFASRVQRGELISVLQNGIWHDQLRAQAQTAKGVERVRRQYQWVGTNPRRASGDTQYLENGASRPSSSGEKQQQQRKRSKTQRGQGPSDATGMRAPDEFPTPPPKRARRSEGSEGAHLNGESMEVDTALSPSLEDAEGEDDPDMASVPDEPTVEVIEVPERYDSMDVATQTEVKVGTKTSTMYWSIGKAGTNILQSTWNPEDKDSFLSVGDGLCRMHWIASDAEDGEAKYQVSQQDLTDLPPNAVVTAAAWHPDGHAAMCALDYAPTEGQPAAQQMLLGRQMKTGLTTMTPSTSLLEPAGLVVCMRYSPPNGDYLLVLRNNLKRGLLQVWDVRQHPAKGSQEDELRPVEGNNKRLVVPPRTEPIAYQLFDRQVLDACWLSSDKIIVVGEDTLTRMYTITADLDNTKNAPLTPTSLTADTILSHGLREAEYDIVPYEYIMGGEACYKVTADTSLGVAAVAASSSDLSVLVVTGPNEDAPAMSKVHLSSQLTDMAFHPLHGSREIPREDDERPWLLLAATLDNGTCEIFEVKPEGRDGLEIEQHTKLHLKSRPGSSTAETKVQADPAVALAWSPDDGSHLAVAGTDMVRIWETSKVLQELKPGVDSTLQPLVEWHFDPSQVVANRRRGADRDAANGTEEDEQVVSEPSLSWSADGSKLAFSAGAVIAVITFRPKLSINLGDQDAEMASLEDDAERSHVDTHETVIANEAAVGGVNGHVA